MWLTSRAASRTRTWKPRASGEATGPCLRDMELCRTRHPRESSGTASAPRARRRRSPASWCTLADAAEAGTAEPRAGGRGGEGGRGFRIGRGDVGGRRCPTSGRVLSTSRVRAGEGIAHPSSSRATAKTAPATWNTRRASEASSGAARARARARASRDERRPPRRFEARDRRTYARAHAARAARQEGRAYRWSTTSA